MEPIVIGYPWGDIIIISLTALAIYGLWSVVEDLISIVRRARERADSEY